MSSNVPAARPAAGQRPDAPTARPDARPRRRRRSDRSRSEARLGWYLAGPAFVIMLAVTLYPILQALYDSLFSLRLTAPDETELVWFRNYRVVLGDPTFWQSLAVTGFITVVTVLVELVLGFLLALVMHRAITRLRGLIRTAILVPYGIITVVSAFAWFYAFDINSGGYVNNWFSWLPGITENLTRTPRSSSSSPPRCGRRPRSSPCSSSPGSHRCPGTWRRRPRSTARRAGR